MAERSAAPVKRSSPAAVGASSPAVGASSPAGADAPAPAGTAVPEPLIVPELPEAEGRGQQPFWRGLERFRAQVRRRAHKSVADNFFRGLSAAGRLHPLARPERHHVEVLRDLPYRADPATEHHLDIYRPSVRPGPFPIVLYVHGGGFTTLSKDTHWLMALIFARFGYLVFNISYRLAPRHPYPAAIADTCAAFEWVIEHAEAYGGDLDRIAVAGESAGANLVTALSVAACYRRDEPWARRVFDVGITPQVALPACGLLQVSDVERFTRRRRLPFWVENILAGVSEAYLRGLDPGGYDLADPLVWLEAGHGPERALPAFFVPVGTRDPLLDDSRRLKRALDRLGAVCETRYYPREIHAFHAMVWRKQAQLCWQQSLEFLRRHIGGDSRPG